MNDWIDRHSVTCANCHQLVDERETVRNLCDGNIEFAAGELCLVCGIVAVKALDSHKANR